MHPSGGKGERRPARREEARPRPQQLPVKLVAHFLLALYRPIGVHPCIPIYRVCNPDAETGPSDLEDLWTV